MKIGWKIYKVIVRIIVVENRNVEYKLNNYINYTYK